MRAAVGGISTALGPVVGGLLLERFWWGVSPVGQRAGGGARTPRCRVAAADVTAAGRTTARSRRRGVVGRGTRCLRVRRDRGTQRGMGEPTHRGRARPGRRRHRRIRAVGGQGRPPDDGRPCLPVRRRVRRWPRARGEHARAALFLLPLYLQSVRGLSAITVGLLFIPFGGSFTVVALSASGVAERYGVRRVLAVGLTVMASGALGVAVTGTVLAYGGPRRAGRADSGRRHGAAGSRADHARGGPRRRSPVTGGPTSSTAHWRRGWRCTAHAGPTPERLHAGVVIVDRRLYAEHDRLRKAHHDRR